jgi:hypothetical protein
MAYYGSDSALVPYSIRVACNGDKVSLDSVAIENRP